MLALQVADSDPHMLAAIHLAEELREAYACKVYASKSRASKSHAGKKAYRSPGLSITESVQEQDLFGPYGLSIDRTRQTGHEICEHLLASLRKQVQEERKQLQSECMQLRKERKLVAIEPEIAPWSKTMNRTVKTTVHKTLQKSVQKQEQLSLI